MSFGAVTPWGFVMSHDSSLSLIDLRDSEWNVRARSVESVEDKIPYLWCLH